LVHTDTIHTLDQVIPAGTSLTINFNDIFYIQDHKSYYAFIRLNFVDDNQANNSVDFIINNSLLEGPDLSLNLVRTPLGECGSGTTPARFTIYNNGCLLPSNQTIYLSIRDENDIEIHATEILLYQELKSRESKEILVEFQANNSKQYTGYVKTNLDINEFNDDEIFTIKKVEEVTGIYFNGFENEFEFDQKLQVNNHISAHWSAPLFEYQGSNWYASCGFISPLQSTNCFGEAETIFNNPDGLTSTLEICVDFDLANLVDPHLSFDMIHFLNQEHEEFMNYAPISNIVRITYTGTAIIDGITSEINEHYLITPQQEGLIIHQNYPLPIDFVGSSRDSVV